MQVDLACKILDGGPFRDDPTKIITVQPAKFEMHGDTYVPKKKKAKKKKKIVKEDKVLGWGGFDDMLPPTQVSDTLHACCTSCPSSSLSSTPSAAALPGKVRSMMA